MLELILWSGLFLFCMSAGLMMRRTGLEGFLSKILSGNFWVACVIPGVFCLLCMAIVHAQWVAQPIRFDHTPAGVTLLSQAVAAMKPIFFSGPSGEIQLMVYGPYVYLFGSVLMPFFDNPFTADAVTGALLFWTFFVLMALLFVRRFGANRGFGAMLVLCSILVFLIPHRFELKEATLLFGTAVSLFACFSIRNSTAAIILAGFGLAVCALSKPQVAMAVLALLPLSVRERGIKWTACAIASFLFFFFAVFLHPSFSFQGYLSLLMEVSETRLTDFWNSQLQWPVIVGSLTVAIFIAALRGNGDRSTLASSIAMLLVYPFALFPATDIASGADQIVYMLPPLMILAGERVVNAGLGGKAALVFGGWFAASLLVLCLPFGGKASPLQQVSLSEEKNIGLKTWEPARSLEKEARNLSEFLEGLNVEVGVSDTKNYMYYYAAKPFLYGNGETISNFTPFMMELFTGWNREYMSAQIAALNAEKVDVFLVPSRGEMFSLNSYFPPYWRVFDDNFTAVFLNHYVLVGKTVNYAVFIAKSRASQIIDILQSRESKKGSASPRLLSSWQKAFFFFSGKPSLF